MSENGLTFKTPEIVGREEEIKRLKKFLSQRGDRHFLYYYAHGGLGKTRLLQALTALVEEANQKEPGYYTTGIIDLYHTDTHSTSDVERAIINGLDPSEKYFPKYRSERKKFEEWRERGIEPERLERHRQTLGNLFVEEWLEMSSDARKLVICFDTVELLQHESSIVEEAAGLDTADTRLKPWLLDKLGKLKNVLVVFAGRPTYPQLEGDFRTAFGKDFTPIALGPLPLNETKDLVKHLSRDGEELIPAQYLPVVHKLTGGRPIFIHLIVDYLQVLVPGTRDYFEGLDKYFDLVDVSEDDPQFLKARERLEKEILNQVFNQTELGEYLNQIALMPKGVDGEILHAALGLPLHDAEQLLERLGQLSFVKQYTPPKGAERLHGTRIFLHDELYRLLTDYKIIRSLRLNEIRTAHALDVDYYTPLIRDLEMRISGLSPAERIRLRERMQKLQVERLYYRLANDSVAGYEEYKRLTEQANRSRSVGFSMRLLDEFLRFYNDDQREIGFEKAEIMYSQIISESTELWVERFYWWGQRERLENFSNQVLKSPDTFQIAPKDYSILANIAARWINASAVLHGYSSSTVQEGLKYLNLLPSLPESSRKQALARARVHTAIGYQLRLGGLLAEATKNYVMAKTAYDQLLEEGLDYPDERTITLNNLAFAYAKQGYITLARTLAHEALNIEGKSDYSKGLNLSTLARIAIMRGNYAQARKYAEKALQLFQEMDDPHGMALARLSLAIANRRLAKHDVEKKWELEDAYEYLRLALDNITEAIEDAQDANLESDLSQLIAERGRIYRELGNVAGALGDAEECRNYYNEGMKILEDILGTGKWATIDRADTYQDLAEIALLSGNRARLNDYLGEMDTLLAPVPHVIPGKPLPDATQSNESYAPLGKSEMLRGQMAFAENRYQDGMEHFVLASVYFSLFSPEAVEIDTMVEYLYNHIRRLPLTEKQNLMNSIQKWIDEGKLGSQANALIENLKALLGT